MTRQIHTFQFPMNSSCTPYNESDFAPEVVQLCADECELLSTPPIVPPNSSSPVSQGSTNPFSLATSVNAVKNSRLRVAKCIVVGDVAVGKTTLINRFVSDVYADNYKATIGVDFEVQKFDILGRPFTLQIWDTAGQQRFRDITRIYYKGAHAVIICFDVGNFSSFLNAKFWLNEVLGAGADSSSASSGDELGLNSGPGTRGPDPARPFTFLIGTKKDLIAARDTQERVHREATELAGQIGAEFWMVSSAGGDNVAELFQRVACLTFNRHMANVAELARQELEQKSNSVFYTANGHKVHLPTDELAKLAAKKSKKASKKKSKEFESNGSAKAGLGDQNGNSGNSQKSAKNSAGSKKGGHRQALVRMVHVPQEMFSKFVANLAEQMQSVMKLKKKKTSKVRSTTLDPAHMSPAATPDSGVVRDMAGSNGQLNSPKKTKKKTFRCFNIRCTFTVEK